MTWFRCCLWPTYLSTNVCLEGLRQTIAYRVYIQKHTSDDRHHYDDEEEDGDADDKEDEQAEAS